MRLLPTTPRRTWLLAAAAWLAGSAATWSALPAQPRAVVPGPDAGLPFGFADDGRAYFGLDDGLFRLWDVATGRRLAEWPSRPEGTTTVAVLRTPDGYAAVVRPAGSPGTRAVLLDLTTGRRDELPWPDIDWADQVRLTPDGRCLVGQTTAGGRPQAEWWDRHERRIVRSHACWRLPVFTPDGGTAIFAALADGTVQAHVLARDLDSGRVRWRFTPPGDVHALSLSPDGATLAIALNSGVVIVDARRGREGARLPRAGPLAWSADSRHVLINEVGEPGNWVTVWNASTGRCVRRCDLSEIGQPVFDTMLAGGLVCFRDGFGVPATSIEMRLSRLPVVGSWFGTSRSTLWFFDAVRDREAGRLVVRDLRMYDLAPDGRTALVVGMDGRLEFWDVPPRRPLAWLVATAALGAAPAAWLARRRVRRLRAATA